MKAYITYLTTTPQLEGKTSEIQMVGSSYNQEFSLNIRDIIPIFGNNPLGINLDRIDDYDLEMEITIRAPKPRISHK